MAAENEYNKNAIGESLLRAFTALQGNCAGFDRISPDIESFVQAPKNPRAEAQPTTLSNKSTLQAHPALNSPDMSGINNPREVQPNDDPRAQQEYANRLELALRQKLDYKPGYTPKLTRP